MAKPTITAASKIRRNSDTFYLTVPSADDGTGSETAVSSVKLEYSDDGTAWTEYASSNVRLLNRVSKSVTVAIARTADFTSSLFGKKWRAKAVNSDGESDPFVIQDAQFEITYRRFGGVEEKEWLFYGETPTPPVVGSADAEDYEWSPTLVPATGNAVYELVKRSERSTAQFADELALDGDGLDASPEGQATLATAVGVSKYAQAENPRETHSSDPGPYAVTLRVTSTCAADVLKAWNYTADPDGIETAGGYVTTVLTGVKRGELVGLQDWIGSDGTTEFSHMTVQDGHFYDGTVVYAEPYAPWFDAYSDRVAEYGRHAVRIYDDTVVTLVTKPKEATVHVCDELYSDTSSGQVHVDDSAKFTVSCGGTTHGPYVLGSQDCPVRFPVGSRVTVAFTEGFGNYGNGGKLDVTGTKGGTLAVYDWRRASGGQWYPNRNQLKTTGGSPAAGSDGKSFSVTVEGDMFVNYDDLTMDKVTATVTPARALKPGYAACSNGPYYSGQMASACHVQIAGCAKDASASLWSGTEKTIAASAGSDFSFLSWEDGSTAASRTYAVPDSDATVTATFGVAGCHAVFTGEGYDGDRMPFYRAAAPGGSRFFTVSGGGTIVSDGAYVFGRDTSVDTERLKAWTFVRWSDGDESETHAGTVTVDSDTTLYPIYEKIAGKYQVFYRPGTSSVTGDGSSQTKSAGVDLTMKTSGFTRTGYTLSGWSLDPGGSTKDYDLGATYSADEDVDLYPYWTEDEE